MNSSIIAINEKEEKLQKKGLQAELCGFPQNCLGTATAKLYI